MPSHTPSGKYLEDALASATSFGNCDTAVIRRPSSTSRDAQFVFRFWSGARDLNPGPHGPEPALWRVLPCPRRILQCRPVLNFLGLRVLWCPPVSAWFRECVTRP